MTDTGPTIRFWFVAGSLCLDFVNTMDWHAAPGPIERLHTYGHLLEWARQGAVLAPDDAANLAARAAERPDEAAAALQAAVALREAIFRIVRGRAEGAPPQPPDIAIVNEAILSAQAHLRLVPDGEGFAWAWADRGGALESPLWPVARSAADLLTSDQLRFARMCDGPGCGWLFLDTTKNKRRRWCTMDGCGNRAKARRYYQRQKQPG